ncbi:unnamed protein product [Echinostoma caproni]|uniref:BEN domain-containing protein n=1 Tax=Echinostoma caproni TaxID=27848 RepID=A0A183A5S2_9TREM|nr:unnamed protein product [Echinostoma caproni]
MYTCVSGQILLCEAHPNVKLSKDIFYSLIVKSSGSATRLIRLLMKSFFTQDELAASSLSGEGIYKQRLEPSVTEAIKIFIRRRHPQLKTGSINLCMTDVCVQARRVANNQRSRQHPIRLTNFSSTNNSNSGVPSPEHSTESSGPIGCNVLLLKDRTTTPSAAPCTTGSTVDLSISTGMDVNPLSSSQASGAALMDMSAWNKTGLAESPSSVMRFSPQDWINERMVNSTATLDAMESRQMEMSTPRDHDSMPEAKSSPQMTLKTITTNSDEIEESR